ncbi:asparagine synthase C-terminal domain-containing protein [Psychrosphaera sp. F3M07]|uniref:asparagine synthase-related protein n=1 Tax=Psychrosphaera sp. F3M07 TaxID=2841560 RepID=UPI001C09DAE2|nr:asparagine synthase C-terminal domain-containing protein [Psychrosphaera sp. F3M07]MBU2917743.1 asparagine synthase C-terminal domain-containing protein [Psychrosphaera sp. F3M07]
MSIKNMLISFNSTKYKIKETKTTEYLILGSIYKNKEKLEKLITKFDEYNIKKLLPEVEGSFVILIWLKDRKEFHFIMDKWASMPIFVNEASNTISERIKSLINKPMKLNKAAANEFIFYYAFLHGNKTLIENVFKAQPAYWYKFSNEHWSSERYWAPRFQYSTGKNNIKEKLNKAWVNVFDDIETFLNGKKVVCPISAGLDSRAILSELAKRGMQKNVTTFTYSLEDTFELDVARNVSLSLGFKHIHLKITGDEIINPNEFIELAEIHDYSIWNSPYVPCSVQRKMKEYGDVLLSGFGGDPIMGSHVAKGKKNLTDYVFTKYRWLFDSEISFIKGANLNKLYDQLVVETSKFEYGDLAENFDSWYLFQRNVNMTQHSVLAHRDIFEIISPFMDNRIIEAVKYMSIENREGRVLFLELMKEMYPVTFKLPSSAHKGKGKELKFFLERVISVLTRTLFGKSLVRNSFDYKPDLNDKFRSNKEFRQIIINNSKYLVEVGLIDNIFLDSIIDSVIKGKRNGFNGQQRFPVLCALSSLAINIKELDLEVS